MLRYLTAGESHGQALVVIMEGLPAGLEITVEQIQAEMGRRRLGYGHGPRQRFEQDELTLIGGVRHGRTLGSPVAIEIKTANGFAATSGTRGISPRRVPRRIRSRRCGRAMPTSPGCRKYGFTDAHDVLERASARETARWVAAGAVAKALLKPLGVDIISHVIQMGDVRVPAGAVRPTPDQLDRVDDNQVRCFDLEVSEAMITEIKAAGRKDGDSLGGVVEVLGFGVPVGLGSHVHWDRKLDALLAQAIMSIQAVKGVEIGDGFEVAGRRGSVAHDPISWDADAKAYRRGSTLAGGTEGGISTGELLVVHGDEAARHAEQADTRDRRHRDEGVAVSFEERTDVTAVPAMGVVAETMVALVLAGEAQRKFGGDSVDEFVRNAAAFTASLS